MSVFWLLAAAISGVPGVVAGVVRDTTGAPLPAVEVYVDSLHRGTTTDLEGQFALPLPAGTHQLKVSCLGYQDTVVRLDLRPGDTVHLALMLHPAALRTDAVVVTAERYAASARLASVEVDVRARKTLDLRTGNSLDALQALNFVQVDVTTGAVANLVSIRGASDLRGGGIGNRVLLLWNGRPANLPGTGGVEWAAFPLDAVAREEVVLGPHSALYGTHAVGGVIQLLPYTPWNAPRFRLRLGAGDTRAVAPWMETSPELKPPHPWLGGTLMGTYRRKSWGFTALWNREWEDGFAENRDINAHRFFSALGWRKDERTDAVLTVTGLEAVNGKPFPWRDVAHPLEVPDAQEGTVQKKAQWNVDLVGRGVWDAHPFRLQLYRLTHHQEDWPRGAVVPQVVVDMLSQGMETQMEGTVGARHRWIVGASLRRDSVHSEVLYGRHHNMFYALFAQGATWLTSRQLLTLGIRWDRSVVDGRESFARWTPRLGWVWVPEGERWTVRLSLAQAFRAPTLAEMFLKRVLVDYLYFVQNPNLRPEVVTSAELGVERRFSRGRMALALFSSRYRDLIDFFPVEGTAGLYQARNRNRAHIQGIDGVADLRVSGPLGLELAYEWLDARDEETGEVLAYRPRHQLRLRVKFRQGRWVAVLSGYARSRIERAVFQTEQPYLPKAFQRWDLRGRYALTPHVALQGEITNLLNVRYELFARYAMPGRVLRVMLDMRY